MGVGFAGLSIVTGGATAFIPKILSTASTSRGIYESSIKKAEEKAKSEGRTLSEEEIKLMQTGAFLKSVLIGATIGFGASHTFGMIKDFVDSGFGGQFGLPDSAREILPDSCKIETTNSDHLNHTSDKVTNISGVDSGKNINTNLDQSKTLSTITELDPSNQSGASSEQVGQNIEKQNSVTGQSTQLDTSHVQTEQQSLDQSSLDQGGENTVDTQISQTEKTTISNNEQVLNRESLNFVDYTVKEGESLEDIMKNNLFVDDVGLGDEGKLNAIHNFFSSNEGMAALKEMGIEDPNKISIGQKVDFNKMREVMENTKLNNGDSILEKAKQL